MAAVTAPAPAVLQAQSGAQPQEPKQKRVLVLYAARRDAQIAVIGDRDLPRLLEHGIPEGLDYYSEFVDQARFPSPEYRAAFRDFLRLKYSGQTFDLIVGVGESTAEFLAANRSELFPDSPFVFFSGTRDVPRPSNATGIVAPLNLVGTLDLIMALQPDVRQIFVVAGAGSGRPYAEAARAQFSGYQSRLSFTYWTGLPTKDLEQRLAALPGDAAVYYLLVDRDGAGETFHPLEYLDRLAEVSAAPIYCWVDSAMDHRTVGGSLKNQENQVRGLAELSLRVLRGEPAASIPIETRDYNVTQVDWRELRRWGISEARVPAGTLFKFREPTAWERYRGYIVGAAALLIGQSALIAALLIQRARRRKAEERERASQDELRASYERIRDLGGRLLHAQDAERAHVARELHDDISQQMALLENDLDMLSRAVPSAQRKLAGESLERAHTIGRSVHSLSHRLHPERLRLVGLVRSLEGLIRELSHAGIPIAFTHENVPGSLPPELTICVYRVTQEALQNAVKYSKARHVGVRLRGLADSLTLNVTDDGAGFDVSAVWRKGLGLISMRERVEALGGVLDVQSTPGAGTRLDLTVPLGEMSVHRTSDTMTIS